MHPELLATWPRADARAPFDAALWSLLANVNNGDHAADVHWKNGATGELLDVDAQANRVRSAAEVIFQVGQNVDEPAVRAPLTLGASAGSVQAATDAALLLRSSGGAPFKHGILFSAASSAVDPAAGTLVGAQAITALHGIDLSLMTFVAGTGRIERYPGIAGRTGWDLAAVSGTTGLRVLADLGNATQVSRLLFQPGQAAGAVPAAVGIIPTGAGGTAGFMAYSAPGADAAAYLFVGSGIAPTTAMDIQTAHTGGASTLPLRLLVDAVPVVQIAPVELALRLENARYLSGRNAANTLTIPIARVNAADQIEFGAAGVTMLLPAAPLSVGGSVGTAQQFLRGGPTPGWSGVTQRASAAGTTAGPTYALGSFGTIPEMACTLTTTGGDLLATFSGTISGNTLGMTMYVALALDGAAEVGWRAAAAPAVNAAVPVSTTVAFTGVAAGTHTVRARWTLNAGTVTAVATYRDLVVTEYKG